VDEEDGDGEGDESRAAEHSVLVWNADGTGEPLVLRGHTGRVATASFSPDGARVITGSFDGTARVFSLDGRTPPVVLADHGGPVRRAEFSPDGARVFTVTDQVMKDGYVTNSDGVVRVWNVDGRGEPVVLRGHKGGVSSASFSPDGRRIVTAGDDGTVRVWPADGAGAPVVLSNHGYKATGARFDPTGRRVASVAEDKRAVIQNADGTGQPLVWDAKVPLKQVEFSPDGRRVAITADNGREVFMWPADGGPVYSLRGHTGFVTTIKFSPDGKYLVTSSSDGTARLWLADGTGQAVALRGADKDNFYWAEFSPDQTRILTVSASEWAGLGTVKARVWSVAWRELVAQLRRRTAECLTVEQRLKYLAESEAEAAARFAACEVSFGRAPAPR
jgi:WD40 repeat protein